MSVYIRDTCTNSDGKPDFNLENTELSSVFLSPDRAKP